MEGGDRSQEKSERDGQDGAAGSGTTMRVDPAVLGNMIGQKERELQDMNDLRTRALEKAISDRDSHLEEAKKRFMQLRDDFQYNLKLLEDRDAELERYDVLFANMKAVMGDKEGEVSDLRVAVDELEARVRLEQKRNVELETYCADRVSEEKMRSESVRHAKDEELHRMRGQAEEMRRDFMRQLKAKDELLETQRRDMGASFDELVKVLESEGREREESLRAELSRKEESVASIKEELGKCELQREEAQRRAEAAVSGGREQDKRRKEVEWELEDVGRKTSAKISELEQEIRALELARKAKAEEEEGIRMGLERQVHAAERALEELQKKSEEQQRKTLLDAEAASHALTTGYESRIEMLGGRLAGAEAERDRQAEAARSMARQVSDLEALRVKETQAHDSKLDAAEAAGREALSAVKSHAAMLELETEGLREKAAAAKAALEQRRRELCDVRDELGRSAEREAALQRKLAGKDVEIGMAAGEAENSAMKAVSDSIKALTQARDRAEAAQAQAEASRDDADKARMEAQALLVQAHDKIVSLKGEVQALKERREAWGAATEGDGVSFAAASRPQSRDGRPPTGDGTRPSSRKGLGVPPHVGSVQQAQILEVDIGTPLDSPIQMPPYPVTPSVAQFFVGTDTLSRPTTADTEGGGVVRTTSGEGELGVENRRLRSVIADMRQEMERLQQQQGGVRDNAMRVEQLELERRELAAKLAKAEAHVKRLQTERDRLISENNSLRAELRRAVDQEEDSGGGLRKRMEEEEDDDEGDEDEWGDVVGVADVVGSVLAQGTRIREQGGREWGMNGSNTSGGGGEASRVAGTARRQLENNFTGLAVSASPSLSDPPLIAGGNIWGARTRIPTASNRQAGPTSAHAASRPDDESDDAGLRVRRRLEAVREGLSLSGNFTTVRDRPNVVGQSGKMTESQSRVATRVSASLQRKRQAQRPPPAPAHVRNYAQGDIS